MKNNPQIKKKKSKKYRIFLIIVQKKAKRSRINKKTMKAKDQKKRNK